MLTTRPLPRLPARTRASTTSSTNTKSPRLAAVARDVRRGARSRPLRRRPRPPRGRNVGGGRRPMRTARTVNSTACCSRYVASRSTIARATTPRTPRGSSSRSLIGRSRARRSPVDRGGRNGDDDLRDAVLAGRLEQRECPSERGRVAVDRHRARRHGREVVEHIGTAHRQQAARLAGGRVEMVDLQLAARRPGRRRDWRGSPTTGRRSRRPPGHRPAAGRRGANRRTPLLRQRRRSLGDDHAAAGGGDARSLRREPGCARRRRSYLPARRRRRRSPSHTLTHQARRGP